MRHDLEIDRIAVTQRLVDASRPISVGVIGPGDITAFDATTILSRLFCPRIAFEIIGAICNHNPSA